MLHAPGLPNPTGMGLAVPYITGRYYSTYAGPPNTTTAVPAIDTIYFSPFQSVNPVTLTGAMIRVSTGGAGSSAKGGIWANSAVSARPLGAPLIVDNTGVATTSSSSNAALAMTGTLAPGIYWAGTKFTGTLPQCVSITGGNLFFMAMVGIVTSASPVTNGLSFADTYSNNMPTMAEGASFTVVGASGIPVLYLTT